MSSRAGKPLLPDEVAQVIQRYGMLTPGAPVLAAVSGGLDSIVLMHVLAALKHPLAVAHFDHQTRQGESAADAAFVQEVCERQGIPFYLGSEPIEADAKRQSRSFEAHARERRYAYLLGVACQLGVKTIAVAHHANDQAETVLMGMLGLGGHIGTAGMPPVLHREDIRLVRPLLFQSREALEAWARQQGLQWREDRSNAEPCCVRNRIRLEILPLLEAHAPHACRALGNWAEQQQADAGLLRELAATALHEATCINADAPTGIVLDRNAFVMQPIFLQRHMIVLLAHRLGVDMSHERTLRLAAFIGEATSGKQMDFGAGKTLAIEGDRLRLKDTGVEETIVSLPEKVLMIPGTTAWGACRFDAQLLRANEKSLEEVCSDSHDNKQYFDYDQLTLPLRVRTRRPGDRMTPLGLTTTQKVSDILINRKTPVCRRKAVPLLISGEDILWAAGVRRAGCAKVDAATRTLLCVEFRYDPS